jgi:hypothetical protein
MPMLAIFGAEVLAAEVATATAAEIAAAEAAKIAAAEAASVAAAETAAAAAAQQAAAQQTAQAGILGIEGAAANAPLTAEAVQSAAMNSGLPPGFEQQLQNVENLSRGPSVQVASADPSAGIKSLQNVTTSPVSGFEPAPNFQGTTAGPQGASPGFFNPSVAPGQGPLQYQLNAPTGGQGMRLGTSLESSLTAPGPINSVLPPPSGLEAGFDKAVKFAEKNPFTAMTGAYMGASALGLLNPNAATFNQEKYDGPLSKYKLSPNFQAGSANPANFQYRPRYAAGGGIMGTESYDIPVGYDEGGDVPEYAKGGSLSDSIESYQKMLAGKPQAAPARSADVGIYYDQDPDTRYQDALTAAQIRQAKVNQRAYVSPPAAKRPTPLGRLNMPTSAKSKGDVEAASGGIMQSSLGGYAAGGNPRLLKGPGDGMSDNIPATINRRQPARLADGEFVIPADVVSHLGNGSTEAGAKQLHAMMDKVRKARTGNPKQGKQIKPQKYMPK